MGPGQSETKSPKAPSSFQEAASVFGDPFSITYPDPDHSIAEQRFITVGTSSGGHVLIVAHADFNENLRIISARKTTRGEREHYEGKN
jgi:uncharacterized DUF497 family protein